MLATLFQTTRPQFLLLTVVVIALVAALALHQGHTMEMTLLALVLIGGLCAHAGVNVLNEVHDAESGLDDLTQRTPFSGGSGALQAHPEARHAAKILGWLLVVMVVLIGCYLAYRRSEGFLPLGVLGVLLVVAYTPLITRIPWLCLIAPGLGFGPVMMAGAYVVLTGAFSASVLAVALIPFFLVNNLLLLNQFPDVEADRQVHRSNVITAYGVNAASTIYRGLLLATFAVLALLVVSQQLPRITLISLICLTLALKLYRGVLQLRNAPPIASALLASNVVLTLSLPALLAIALLLDA